MSSIGQRIKQLRIKNGLTVDQLAEKLGKNRATVYRYENNDIENLPITILEPLALALNSTPAYIMGWEETSLVTNYLKMLQSCNIDYECVVGDGTESSIYIIKTSNGELKISYKQLIELAENTKAFLYSDLMEFLFRQKKNLLLASKENFLKDKKKTYNYTITSAARGEGLEKHTVQSDLSPEEIAKINKDSALERDDKLF